jgi:hypothetical protein
LSTNQLLFGTYLYRWVSVGVNYQEKGHNSTWGSPRLTSQRVLIRYLTSSRGSFCRRNNSFGILKKIDGKIDGYRGTPLPSKAVNLSQASHSDSILSCFRNRLSICLSFCTLGCFCHEASVLTFHLPSSPRYTLPFYKSRELAFTI